MNNEISSLPQTQLKRIRFSFVAIVLLAITTYVFHKSALSGFWNNDDGQHMAFAAQYSPWQYFFVPEITRLIGLHVTPWIAFFYDVNLWLFGLNPKGFYAHQLFLLWLAGMATFFFLRLWIVSTWALFGALIFLAGAPTVHVAHTLMTGHYAAGLSFTIIALYSYVKAVRERRRLWALAGALFYLLAASCKEIYVPLIGILLILPTSAHFKDHFRFSLPFGMVAIFYVFWRRQVLGGFIGGYKSDATIDPILAVKALGHIPFLLLGDNALGKVALSVIAMLILFNLRYGRINLKLLIVGAVLLLLPLVPIVLLPTGILLRYLFLVWWGVAVFIATLLSTYATNTIKRVFVAIGLFLVGVTVNLHYAEQRKVLLELIPHERAYYFMLNSNSSQFYLPPGPYYSFLNFILGSMVKSEKAINPLSPQRAGIMKVEDDLASLDLAKTSVWTYDDTCKCNKDISADIPGMVLEFQKKQLEKPLSLQVELASNVLIWEAGPYNEGDYEFVLTGPSTDFGVYPVPRKWSMTWFWFLSTDVDLYLRYKSPEGWITRSPVFHLKPSSAVTWSR